MRPSWTLLVTLLFAAMPASAELITFGFAGTVTEKYELGQLCPTCPLGARPTTRLAEVPVGSAFSGWYSFDTNSPDLNPQDIDSAGTDFPDGTLGAYDILAGQLDLNGVLFDMLNLVQTPGVSSSINIANNYIIGDAYSFISSLAGPLLNGYQGSTMSFLVDYPNNSDALTDQLPSGFSSSDSRPFTAQFTGGRDGRLDDVTVRGRFERFFIADNPTPMPLPSSLLLVLFGLWLVRLRQD